MTIIVAGSGLFDVEQTTGAALLDFIYRAVPAGIAPAAAAANLTAEQAFSNRGPPLWTHLARAGFSYRTASGGLLHRLAQTFGMQRLDSVHQFDFKQDPHTGRRWPQKRFGHSIDVAAVANLLAHHNADALPPSERKALVVAALLHDILMPPGGETVKHIDMARFDEDANFPDFVQAPAFQRFAVAHDIDAEAVGRIMTETDAAGRLKDLADKIGYVCRDVEHLLAGHQHLPDGQVGVYHSIRTLIGRCPEPGKIWRSIRVRDNQVVVEDAEGLCDFLELRALLFAGIYQSPHVRTEGYVYSEVIIRWLYETGQMTADRLVCMTDVDLDMIVDRYVDFAGPEDVFRLRFNTLADAQRVQREHLQCGVVFSTVVDYSQSCKPATHYLVPTDNGPKPLSEACPQRAERIHDLVERAHGIYLFGIRSPKASFRPGLLQELLTHALTRSHQQEPSA